MTDTAFATQAKQIAAQFLHTVVVVDDEALRPAPPPRVEDEPPAQEGAGLGTDRDLIVPDEGAEALPTSELLDAFAESGLICGLLDPGDQENLSRRFVNATRRADLIVLDWMIAADNGRTARNLLAAVIDEDNKSERRRLRAVAIYTGQDDLTSIADTLAKDVRALLGLELTPHDEGLSFTCGPLHVAVYAKQHVPPEGPAGHRRVAVAELPERLIAEFSRLTAGLVSGVALRSLAALRHDTHRILDVLSRKLDIGYLGHRAALPDPLGAEEHLVDMVTAEIRAVLDDNEVGQAAALAAIRDWMTDPAHAADWGKQVQSDKPGKPISHEQIEKLVEYGIGLSAGIAAVYDPGHTELSKKYLEKTVKRQAHRAFGNDLAACDDSDARFALRMTLRTHYSRPVRVLQLGTIVNHDGCYRLCVQPLCDSVRLPATDAFPFPFLELKPVEDGAAANFVVWDRDNEVHVRLASPGKPASIRIHLFAPGSGGRVEVEPEQPCFKDASGDAHVWVADLKMEFARSAAVELGQQFARLGVDEPEILRLSRRDRE